MQYDLTYRSKTHYPSFVQKDTVSCQTFGRESSTGYNPTSGNHYRSKAISNNTQYLHRTLRAFKPTCLCESDRHPSDICNKPLRAKFISSRYDSESYCYRCTVSDLAVLLSSAQHRLPKLGMHLVRVWSL
jgi:hypothetical protein